MASRHASLFVLFLAACVGTCVSGCVSSDPARPSGTPWQAFKVDADPGPDRVLFDVALVQRPLGDEFLENELWAGADEMIVSGETRELFELNGYRVGLLVGSPGEKLTNLLQSERSCVERKGRSVPSGERVMQVLREATEPVDATVYVGKSRQTLPLEQPRFGLEILPTMRASEIVRLKISPRVEMGDKAIDYKPIPEESKWSLEVKRPSKSFADLSFEVDLAPNQILIVGPRLEREDTLGYQSLVDVKDGNPSQRLLILRHLRPRGSMPRAEAVDVQNPANPPLAMQALR